MTFSGICFMGLSCEPKIQLSFIPSSSTPCSPRPNKSCSPAQKPRPLLRLRSYLGSFSCFNSSTLRRIMAFCHCN
ncbi:hypothetical protein SLA2020_526810 [Shorea laevis]